MGDLLDQLAREGEYHPLTSLLAEPEMRYRRGERDESCLAKIYALAKYVTILPASVTSV